MLSCAGLQYSLKAFPKQSQKILESEILEPATIGMCRVIYRTFFWYKTRCLRGAFIFLVEKWIDKVINISRRSDRMIIITVRYRFKVLFWKSSQYICNSVVYKIVKMIIFMIVLTVLLTICGKENCSHSWRFQWTCCRCARLWGPQLTPLTP